MLRTKKHVEYRVRVENYEAGEYDLVFDTRDKARAYKRLLLQSKRNLTSKITKVEYQGDYIYSETEVS